MTRRGKRGVSKGSRNFEGAVYEIEFRNGLAFGENRHRFMADFNRSIEKHCNFWESWKIVKGEPYDRAWLAVKALWNIPNNDAKKTMRKKANEAFRRFKSKLTTQFVKKNNKEPKATYPIVNMTHWDEFVVSRESDEFKLKSAKAKASALKNKNPSRLGRTPLNEMEETWIVEWDQLVLRHPWLSVIQNKRSKIYALAHLPKDKVLGTRPLIESMEGTLRQLAQKEQDMREDGTYHVLGRDPITEVFGKEHGGRTKGVSTVLGVRTALGWVKGDRERHEVVDIAAIQENITKRVTAAFQEKFDRQEHEMEGLKTIVAHLQEKESMTCLGSSCTSDVFDDLEDPTPCDLLWPYGSEEFRVAIGKVYPTRDATLHGFSISEGHAKVQVDTVEDAYRAIPVPKQTEKVHQLEQSLMEFIEWPRKNIKIHQTISPSRSMCRSSPVPTVSTLIDLSSSLCYRPSMEDLMPLEHQIPAGGYMNLLESQGGLLPQVPVELPTPSHLSKPSKRNKTQEERVNDRLVQMKYRSKQIQGSAKRFSNFKSQLISVVAPYEMYGKHWEELIEYEAILDLHIHGKIDITFIHWWTMHLYSLVKDVRDNKCAFFNPQLITSSNCLLNLTMVVDHIKDIMRLNAGKEIFMAPYMQGDNHWVLIVLCLNSKKGYLVDSYEYKTKDENSYYFPKIVESALDIKFHWTTVKCLQQEGEWECGYYMMKFMHELAMKKQADFPQNIWVDSRHLKLSEIDQVATMVLNEFYRTVVAKDTMTLQNS